MLLRRTGKQGKTVGAESAATSDPSNKLAIPDTFALNRSDEVTAVLQASYDFAKNCPCIRTLHSKHKKALKVLVKQIDTVFQKFLHDDDDNNIPEDVRVSDSVGLAQAYYYIANVYFTNAVVNLNSAHIYALRSVLLLEGYELRPDVFMTAIRAYHCTCCLFEKLSMFGKVYEYAETAMLLYTKYRRQHGIHTVSVDLACLCETEKTHTVQERLLNFYTIIMKGLFQMRRLEVFEESRKFKVLEYQHTFLEECLHLAVEHRQIEIFITTTHDLVKSLLRLNRFTEARDHIAAAHFVVTSGLHEGKYICSFSSGRQYQQDFALIDLMWGIYGIRLLQSSYKRLLQKYEDDSVVENADSTSTLRSEEIKLSTLLFVEMKNKLQPYTSLITDTFATDYGNATEIFVFAIQSLFRSLYHKSADTKSRITILLHIADAFKHFGYYQLSEEKETFNVTESNYLENILKLRRRIFISSENADDKYMLWMAHLKKAIVCSDFFEYFYETYEPFYRDFHCRYNEDLQNIKIITTQNILREFNIFLDDMKQIS